MAKVELIKIPDIGGAEAADVIEVFVKKGDILSVDAPLITLEGDKATMDIPSPLAGEVVSVKVSVGDKVSMDSPIIELALAPAKKPASENNAAKTPSTSGSAWISIPDLSGAAGVKVIELLVSVGDVVEQEQSLITLEGDKASMDIPSPSAGTVEEIAIAIGDEASVGTRILKLSGVEGAVAVEDAPKAATQAEPPASQSSVETLKAPSHAGFVHASPAVRRTARELDIDVSVITGTGKKGRITREDLRQHVTRRMNAQPSAGPGFAPMPEIDFSKFGAVTTQSLTKIQRFSGKNLHRNWVSIPHVTQFAQADITELEAFRKQEKVALEKQGIRLTPLVFLMKAAVAALKAFPTFNASLAPDGESIILKEYTHIGVAVDTPNGLVVPVIRDVDQKGLVDLAKELGEISLQAREKGLSMAQMQGGCFTISSLGGIGGTAFTPIINAPEVAIMGVSRTQTQAVWTNGMWEPRLMLPLSLSYDHRVIDGATAAKFATYFADCLQDMRRLLM